MVPDKLQKVAPPALPQVTPEYNRTTFDQLSNALRLYFNRLSGALNALLGRQGGRYIENPNGVFWDDGDQPMVAANTAQPVRFNQTYLAAGVSVNGPTTSQVTAQFSGVYNFQFTGLARSGTSSTKVVWLWIAKNGSDIGFSTKEYSVAGSGKELEIVRNFVIDLLAGDYVELIWAADDDNILLDAAGAAGPHPGVPSAVITVNFVSALPEDLPALP